MRQLIFILALAAYPTPAAAGAIPTRTPVGSFPIAPSKAVTHVELTRVDFLPGQQMPEHMHPVPVVCFVIRGSFLVSIGASQVRRVDVGDTTLEPAGTVVHYFRNLTKDLAQLDCASLGGAGDKVLSVMLDASHR
jgi:quercetin dioxygenase-like cupin family protein